MESKFPANICPGAAGQRLFTEGRADLLGVILGDPPGDLSFGQRLKVHGDLRPVRAGLYRKAGIVGVDPGPVEPADATVAATWGVSAGRKRSGWGRRRRMCASGSDEGPSFAVDYAAVFRAFAGPALLLTPDLLVVDANQAFLDSCGHVREDLVGSSVFDVPVQDPMVPGDRLRASVERVLATREPDTAELYRYDLPVPGRRPGRSEERYWSSFTAPVLGPDGEVLLIISQVKDVTALVRARVALHNGETLSGEEATTAALLAWSRELQKRNENLRRAHEQESEIAVSLQRAMLPDTARERTNVAVRYRPATSALHVCGDWYDFLELGPGWLAVAVGDVVGHGLTAAGIMGQLRSALSTAMHATGQPARALKALAHYAVTIEGALATTAVQTVIDETTHTITYSRAGHPPPLLLDADMQAVQVLDQAADPPLGALEPEVARTQSTLSYRPGSTLVLYTDGLIERRDQDIDTGLARLIQNLTRHGHLGPEPLADALLTDIPRHKDGPDDDIALVVVQL
ncbi:PP2C family protein-serine/threonine phosphatase [Streptomyces sp. 136MFCol5.1]|uniref:PP2C family protein-serine/threonine phosphatase n=1 Tax=Streptomyces sp. 136MFCol5.1 TaxID=1172182 RepID=UPI0035238BDA